MTAALVFGLLMQVAAADQSAAPPPGGIIPEDQVEWVRRPTAAEVSQFYPIDAMRAETAGGTAIQCVVGADGRLTDCQLLYETPTGFGFGKAALTLSKLFRVAPRSTVGKATAGDTVKMPINFRPPPSTRAGPVRLKKPEFHGQSVTVDCRLQKGRFQNCFPLTTKAVSQEALDWLFADLERQTTQLKTPAGFGRVEIAFVFD